MSTTIEHDGFSITSNTESEAAMRSALGVEAINAEESRSDAGLGANAASGDEQRSGATGVSEVLREDAAGEGAAEIPATQERRAKPRDNPQARISQAIAKQHDAERKAADLEARLAALEQNRSQPAPKEEPIAAPAPTQSGEPDWELFEGKIGAEYPTWAAAQNAFMRAHATWNRQQWQAELHQQAEQQSRRQAGQTHLERVNAARKTYPDFDQAVEAVAHIAVTPALESAILGLDNSADVVYWLATHPDEFSQLASETQALGVVAAPVVKRLLEARVGAGVRSGTAPSAELSRAKPPVRPVGVSSVVLPDEPGDDEPFDAYFKRQNSIDRKRGKL